MEKKAARKSDNARGKLLEYSVLEKSKYFTPIEHDFSIEDKKVAIKELFRRYRYTKKMKQ